MQRKPENFRLKFFFGIYWTNKAGIALQIHRRGSQNKTTNAVPQHFNQNEHTPLELINSKRESIRRARETMYIEMAITTQPHGINREDDR